MDQADYRIDLRLADQKVKFEGISQDHPELPVAMDFTPPLGSDEGFAGLELLMMSFSSCVSTAVVALLRRAGMQIGSFRAHVCGYRKEQALPMLGKIVYEAEIQSPNGEEAVIQKVLDQARSISPVWLLIGDKVEVETHYSLTK